jgi:hypothetical protein
MLKGYSKRYNAKTMSYDDKTPLHNTNSNFADSFRYAVISAVTIMNNKVGIEKVKYV